jgi:hypothetical protein
MRGIRVKIQSRYVWSGGDLVPGCCELRLSNNVKSRQ